MSDYNNFSAAMRREGLSNSQPIGANLGSYASAIGCAKHESHSPNVK